MILIVIGVLLAPLSIVVPVVYTASHTDHTILEVIEITENTGSILNAYE